MTAAASAPALPAPSRAGDELTGTGTMVRLGLRRERIPLAVWVYGVCLTVLVSYPTLKALYPDQASRDALVTGIGANPAFLVLVGPLHSTSIGGLTAWRYGVLGATMIALMAIFTVVRRTRGDEEAGRTELLASGVLGRLAPLTAALVLAAGAAVVIGLLVAVGSALMGQPVAGSFAFGAALAGPGLVFAGIAAIAAQLVESARTATAISGAVLGVTFAVRAVADASPGLRWLGWLSPLDWSSEMRPFGGNRWAVAVLFLVVAAASVAVAVRLRGRRDLGLGFFPARLGRASNPRLGSALALATRLQRGTLIGWAVALAATGAISGAIAPTADSLISGTSQQLLDLMRELGGPGTLSQTMLVTMGGIAGLLAGVYSISAVLRLSSEETAMRAEPVLATAVPRWRWMSGHLLYAIAGPPVVLLVGGVVTGLVNGAGSPTFGPAFGDGLVSMVVQIPAAVVMGGIAALLFGLFPRWTSLAWAAIAAALLLGQLGPLLQLPRWVMDLSPFSHVPGVPAQEMRWTPVVVLLLVAAALVAAGVAGFRRRDVRST